MIFEKSVRVSFCMNARMHSRRMRTSRSLPYAGVGREISLMEEFLSRGSLSIRSLSRGLCQQDPLPLPPVNRMGDRCKNITLPQTSFAGGNSSIFWSWCTPLRKILDPPLVYIGVSTRHYTLLIGVRIQQ